MVTQTGIMIKRVNLPGGRSPAVSQTWSQSVGKNVLTYRVVAV